MTIRKSGKHASKAVEKRKAEVIAEEKKPMPFYMAPSFKKRVRIHAAMNEKSINALITDLLEQDMKKAGI